MKLHVKLLVATLAVAASTAGLFAQDSDNRPRQRAPGGPNAPQQRPPIAPLVATLDANHDGVIDATELDNAAAALRKLDKNNDGKLTREELRPPRFQGGQGGEFRGPRGEGRGPRQGRPPGGPGHRPPAPDHDVE